MSDTLASLSVAELREMAKKRDIKGISKMKKAELLAILSEQRPSEEKISDPPAAASDRRRTSQNTNGRQKTAEKNGSKTSSKIVKKRPMSKQKHGKRQEGAPAKAAVHSENSTQRQGEPMEGFSSKTGQPAPQQHRVIHRSARVHAQEDAAGSAELSPSELSQAAGHAAEQENVKKTPPHYEDAHECSGILEVMAEGYGFLRSDNYLPGDSDVYVSPSQIRRFNLKTGDIITGATRKNNQNDKFGALLYITKTNGMNPEEAASRKNFEDLTPIFPNERIRLELPGAKINPLSLRIVDLISPIGKGQRGMIVSPPKAGKTTLLKQIARSVTISHPDMHLLILLIDERPEEVTDMKEAIRGENVEVIYSTFDELPEHHKRVSEMVIERAKRLVEHGKDVMILLDSITRLARAYNLTVPPSGRTLSGGLDPAALHMPKRFFGAARNMREGGSLTILATALVDTGSKMDDVVFEEFKGTGNMELVLDRKLSEKRVFPAIDLAKSSTRKDDLLLTREEQKAEEIIRRNLSDLRKDEATETILHTFEQIRTNADLVRVLNMNRKM